MGTDEYKGNGEQFSTWFPICFAVLWPFSHILTSVLEKLFSAQEGGSPGHLFKLSLTWTISRRGRGGNSFWNAHMLFCLAGDIGKNIHGASLHGTAKKKLYMKAAFKTQLRPSRWHSFFMGKQAGFTARPWAWLRRSDDIIHKQCSGGAWGRLEGQVAKRKKTSEHEHVRVKRTCHLQHVSHDTHRDCKPHSCSVKT